MSLSAAVAWLTAAGFPVLPPAPVPPAAAAAWSSSRRQPRAGGRAVAASLCRCGPLPQHLLLQHQQPSARCMWTHGGAAGPQKRLDRAGDAAAAASPPPAAAAGRSAGRGAGERAVVARGKSEAGKEKLLVKSRPQRSRKVQQLAAALVSLSQEEADELCAACAERLSPQINRQSSSTLTAAKKWQPLAPRHVTFFPHPLALFAAAAGAVRFAGVSSPVMPRAATAVLMAAAANEASAQREAADKGQTKKKASGLPEKHLAAGAAATASQ